MLRIFNSLILHFDCFDCIKSASDIWYRIVLTKQTRLCGLVTPTILLLPVLQHLFLRLCGSSPAFSALQHMRYQLKSNRVQQKAHHPLVVTITKLMLQTGDFSKIYTLWCNARQIFLLGIVITVSNRAQGTTSHAFVQALNSIGIKIWTRFLSFQKKLHI